MRYLAVFFAFLLAFPLPSVCQAGAGLKQTDRLPGYVPKDGYVPDSRTAIAIAVAVLIPIYGEEEIQSKSPFIATLKNEKWTVIGTMPKNQVGGTTEVQLSKASGKILKVSSTK